MRRFLYAVLIFAAFSATDMSMAEQTKSIVLAPGLIKIYTPRTLERVTIGSPVKFADIDGFWVPEEKDIGALEEAVLAYFPEMQNPLPPGDYARQYVGIEVDGKKRILGNFYPAALTLPDPEKKVHYHDAAFWYVLYDFEKKSVLDIGKSAGGEYITLHHRMFK
jgi:hypothetical protein